MVWQESPYTLLLISTAVASAVSAFYVWRRLGVHGSETIAMILLACAAWSLGYSLELSASTLSSKLFWARLQYPSIAAVPLALFVFALQFSGRHRWVTPWNLAILSVIPVASVLLAFTNEYHGLFWTSASIRQIGQLSALVFERGIVFWVLVFNNYVLVCGVILVILQMLLRSVHLYRWQASALLSMAMVPWLSNLLYVSEFNPFPRFDLTPVTTVAACLLFSWSVSRLRMGDLMAVSREAIIEGIGDAIIVLDAQDRVVSLNSAAERVIGRLAAQLVGKSVQEIWPEKWEPVTQTEGVGDGRREIVLQGEDGLHHYDARFSAIEDWRGQRVSQVIVLREVTDRKKAEDALKESEERYRVLVESVDDAILVKDTRGRYVMVNSEMALRFGRSKEEIMGRMPAEIHSAEMAGKVADDDRRVLTEGVSVDTEEHHPHRLRANIVHTRKAPLRGHDGRIIGLVSIGRDITDRRRLEEQLLRAQRMETAGRLAGQVAHDFNNLLGPLMAYPELMKAQLPEGHPATAYCDAMLEAAERMAAINEDMMALGRRGHFDHQPVDVNLLVRDAVDQMRDVPETLRVQLSLADDLLPVLGSPAQLLRVVVNLLSNAREAMLDNGDLVVETGNVCIDGPLARRRGVAKGEYVKLQLSDTGCGIPDEIREKIFEAFFTTKTRARRRGCGLGLSIVQAIMGDHQGFVELESQVDKGTVFSVYLPICRDAADAVDGAVAVQGGTETVLVLDDDQLQREVSKRLLEKLGYRVVEAGCGEDALAYLAAHEVDLMILDMILGSGLDGTETYRRALEIRPGTPAIVVSGFAESDRVREAHCLGAGAYVRKPVTLERLARAVRDGLDRRGAGDHAGRVSSPPRYIIYRRPPPRGAVYSSYCCSPLYPITPRPLPDTLWSAILGRPGRAAGRPSDSDGRGNGLVEREHRRAGGSLLGPLILVALGIMLLLNNLGLLAWSVWETLFRLWPLLLIALGLDLIVSRSSLARPWRVFVSLVMVLIILGIVAAGAGLSQAGAAASVFGMPAVTLGTGPLESEVINQPLSSAQRAEIELGLGMGVTTVRAQSEPATLIEGTVDLVEGERLLKEYRMEGDTAIFSLRQDSMSLANFGNQSRVESRRWDLRLNPEVPIKLKMSGGVGKVTLDLSRLKVTDLEVNMGISKTDVTLPKTGQVRAEVAGGIGDATILIPRGMAARIETHKGIGNVTVSGNYQRDGSVYYSPGYDSAQDRVALVVKGGIGSLRIQEQNVQ